MIRRMSWPMATLAAALVFAACGDSSSTTDGGNSCTSDSSCGTGRACHPVTKQCVTSCTASSDCPSAEKTCDVINGSTAKFCQCSTDALCDSSTSGEVCSAATRQCEAKCTSSSNCPTGSTCNSSTGQCSAVGNSDAGTDAGTTTDAGTDAGMSCDMSQLQPSTCAYGSYCTTASECFMVPAPTCSNFPAGSAPLNWTTASTGPVIIFISQQMALTESVAFCGATNPVRGKVRIRAYDTNGARLDGEASQPTLSYYRTTGSPLTIGATEIQDYMSESNGSYAEFDVNVCAPTGTTSLPVGFSFQNGNGYCFTLTN